MIRYKHLREIREGHERATQAQGGNLRQARIAFLRETFDILGLGCDPHGVPQVRVDHRGLPDLKPGRCSATEFSLREMADAICGHDFVDEYYHPASGLQFSGLRENAVDPTAFLNISTFSLATAGLVQAEIMERFMQPAYIGRELVRIVPTKKNGDKLIAVARMGAIASSAKGRGPGEAHASVGFGEAYQTTPETVEQALKCSITRESVYFDQTVQVMEEAAAVGVELGYGQDKDICSTVIGAVNSYNRNGTSHNTYQTTSPFVNDHTNEMEDYTDLDNCLTLFRAMLDPESGKEIVVDANTLLIAPNRQFAFNNVLRATEVRNTTNTNTVTIAPNPLNGGTNFTVKASQIWYNKLLAAAGDGGLGLTSSQATGYWWMGDFQKAFEWRENWPLTPWQASPDELHLKDHGLVSVHGANYRGVPYSREPRYVVRNKKA